MSVNQATIRKALEDFDFKAVFIEELGWDHLKESLPPLNLDGVEVTLTSIAQKRGLRVIQCAMADGSIPDLPTRLKIDRKVAEFSQERLLVFVDAARSRQAWLWVKNEAGRKRPRSFQWHKHQSNDDLVQRLSRLNIEIAEETTLTIASMAQRTKSAFDVEKVTKRFYDRFKKEHDSFLNAIEGINDVDNRDWYTSLMLNRLMFLYFIQRKGFLAEDQQYLRTKLTQIRQVYGADVSDFYDFYTKFLRVLFHDGLSKPTYSPSLKQLIGDVPYLNGGLFDVHQLEHVYPTIRIPDLAFERLFDFFDGYQWHLDDRPDKADNEINPDVLGYIFEKYINQKQMGAYYTKEDITEYISKNTIIPAIFERAAQAKDAAPSFAPDGWIWAILRHDPDQYMYPAVRHEVEHEIPSEIAAGIDDVSQRTAWNKPVPFGLPTETWREYIARRQRYENLKQQMIAGELTTINDLITHNLDIVAFARDVITLCDHAPTLRAIYNALENLSVLDPTCGSGAFLFAALNILQPLYELCLQRMKTLMQGKIDDPAALSAFNEVLARVDDRKKHPNRQYFILKTIILQNLYGVDIMEEAVEICKLRLFLKLVAQASTLREVEPLPDIDFNIRAGNTLVGYAKYADVVTMLDSKMDLTNSKATILTRAETTSTSYRAFRDAQTDYTVSADQTAERKAQLRAELDALNGELNQHLAHEYGVDASKPKEYAAWLASHKPLHWFVEFYAIIEDRGGFDVIIGNPPYVGYPKVRNEYTIINYATEKTANLYAFTIERSLRMINRNTRFGMIVPIASVSTESMKPLQSLYKQYTSWNSHFAVRPGKLFIGVDMNLTITLLTSEKDIKTYSTGYIRWSDSKPSNRPYIFEKLAYHNITNINLLSNKFPKIGHSVEIEILRKMTSFSKKLGYFENKSGEKIYYHSGGRYWRKAILQELSSHYKPITIAKEDKDTILSILNSQLFYWFWIQNSNCMDVVSREVFDLPVFDIHNTNKDFINFPERLLQVYYSHNTTRERRGDIINTDEINFDVSKAKPIIDEIDRVLAQHYGFTDEELDFIINYDIKYRMGKSEEEE